MILGKDVARQWGIFYNNLLPQECLKILLMDVSVDEEDIIRGVCIRDRINNDFLSDDKVGIEFIF